MDPMVKGICPACGTANLVLHDDKVRCEKSGCPRPDTVWMLLSDTEVEHIVRVNKHDFTVRHPLRERVGTELLDCLMHAMVADDLEEHDDTALGTYRVWLGFDGGLLWEVVQS
jgi:hypothetical protein